MPSVCSECANEAKYSHEVGIGRVGIIDWQPSEVRALREAIHNNHTDFEDGLDCCQVRIDQEVCPAHSLLNNPQLLEYIRWYRLLYRVSGRIRCWERRHVKMPTAGERIK